MRPSPLPGRARERPRHRRLGAAHPAEPGRLGGARAALASALGLSAWLPLPLTALGIGAIEKPLPSRFVL
jgi:hypothetical protein